MRNIYIYIYLVLMGSNVAIWRYYLESTMKVGSRDTAKYMS